MAHIFVWNRSESLERRAIERFLRQVCERVDRVPERLPFRPELGKLVLAWAPGLLDLKPSEMCSGHMMPEIKAPSMPSSVAAELGCSRALMS